MSAKTLAAAFGMLLMCAHAVGAHYLPKLDEIIEGRREAAPRPD